MIAVSKDGWGGREREAGGPELGQSLCVIAVNVMHAWRRYPVWSFLDVDVACLVLHVSLSTRMNVSKGVQKIRLPAGLTM